MSTQANTSAQEALQRVGRRKLQRTPKQALPPLQCLHTHVPTTKARVLIDPARTTVVQPPLRPYQEESLFWMRAREASGPPYAYVDEANRRVRRFSSSRQVQRQGERVWVHCITNEHSPSQPQECNGGILADEMGLGKTMQILSLVASSSNTDRLPTLVVCPLSVLTNWELQLEKHVRTGVQGGLSWAVHDPTQRGGRPLQKADLVLGKNNIILATYDTVKGSGGSVLLETHWQRVVLDEAHTIKNPNAAKSIAVMRLQARSRWCVTATPVQNRVSDFYAYLKFLREPGLQESAIFRDCFTRQLAETGRLGGDNDTTTAAMLDTSDQKIKALREVLMMRRMCGEVIPQHERPQDIVRKTVYLPLDNVQREFYNALVKAAYKDARGGKTLCMLTMMRRFCSGGFGVVPVNSIAPGWSSSAPVQVASDSDSSSDSDDADGDAMDWAASREVKLNGEDEAWANYEMRATNSDAKCDRCGTNLPQPYDPENAGRVIFAAVTTCAHLLCLQCMNNRHWRFAHNCERCADFTPSTIICVKQRDRPLIGKPDFIKMQYIGKELLGIYGRNKLNQRKNPRSAPEKAVVFSQWTAPLMALQAHLDAEEAPYRTRMLCGELSSAKRTEVLKDMAENNDAMVLLATMGTAGVGIELTTANHVFFVDQFWNPAIEDQAIARVHRMGQKRRVEVSWLLIEDTIEKEVGLLQGNKRMMMAMMMRAGSKVDLQLLKEVFKLLK